MQIDLDEDDILPLPRVVEDVCRPLALLLNMLICKPRHVLNIFVTDDALNVSLDKRTVDSMRHPLIRVRLIQQLYALLQKSSNSVDINCWKKLELQKLKNVLTMN